jgi:hypothetical protein
VGLVTRYYFLSECCCQKFAVLFLWSALTDEERGSAICSVITQWSESRRTRNHTLLSHLRLPQPGGSGSHIYIPQGTGWPSYTSGIGLPLCCLLRLAWLWWRYSNPPPTWKPRSLYTNIYPSGTGCSSLKSRYDRQSVNQYGLVPSPRGITGIPSKRISIQHQEGYIKETFFMLPLGGLHVKHAVQRGIWVLTQHLLWDHGKPWKNFIELAGRRAFQMQTGF